MQTANSTVLVGVGDSVDRLDAALVLRTCTAAGRILSLSAPLVATPAQLTAMLDCPAGQPHSCAGKLWFEHIISQKDNYIVDCDQARLVEYLSLAARASVGSGLAETHLPLPPASWAGIAVQPPHTPCCIPPPPP